jgi:hypothetical protein
MQPGGFSPWRSGVIKTFGCMDQVWKWGELQKQKKLVTEQGPVTSYSITNFAFNYTGAVNKGRHKALPLRGVTL